MPVKKESLFEKLSKINVSKFTEKKGKFTYLSWSWAVSELKKVSPEAYWIIHEWGTEGNEKPYQQTESGCFVKVTVIAEGVEMTQIHPVLDNRNNTIKTPNAFEINTSIMRCLTKAISLHGLGLYIYSGEDLPLGESEKPKPLSNGQIRIITDLQEDSKIDSDTYNGVSDMLTAPEDYTYKQGEAAIMKLHGMIDVGLEN
tara:strand:+ start:35 stop:634 length:600 start_codon:yes stop_codon:yes gene_type:complete